MPRREAAATSIVLTPAPGAHDERQMAGVEHRLGDLAWSERSSTCAPLARSAAASASSLRLGSIDDVAAERREAVDAGCFELVRDENFHAGPVVP